VCSPCPANTVSPGGEGATTCVPCPPPLVPSSDRGECVGKCSPACRLKLSLIHCVAQAVAARERQAGCPLASIVNTLTRLSICQHATICRGLSMCTCLMTTMQYPLPTPRHSHATATTPAQPASLPSNTMMALSDAVSSAQSAIAGNGSGDARTPCMCSFFRVMHQWRCLHLHIKVDMGMCTYHTCTSGTSKHTRSASLFTPARAVCPPRDGREARPMRRLRGGLQVRWRPEKVRRMHRSPTDTIWEWRMR
jgi:hypothetical protein